MSDEYQISVTFFRNLADDAGVIGKKPGRVTDKQLMELLRKELQAAYSETLMAGRFEIIKLKRQG